MIQFFHTLCKPPAFLVGATNLSTREVRDGWTFGVGEGWFLGPPPETAIEISGGFKCWMNDDGAQPESLFRTSPWLRTSFAIDSKDRTWSIPIILDSRGKRAFKVSYGADWKPALSPSQEELLKIAEEAGIFMNEINRDGEIENAGPGCAIAARLLEETNHISSEVIGKLHLMDDVLMVGTLLEATSRRALEVEDHG